MWARFWKYLGNLSFFGLLSIILWKLFEDRLLNWANAQIDTGTPAIAARIIHWLDSTPGGFLISIVILTALAIAVHAYWTARRSTTPGPSLADPETENSIDTGAAKADIDRLTRIVEDLEATLSDLTRKAAKHESELANKSSELEQAKSKLEHAQLDVIREISRFGKCENELIKTREQLETKIGEFNQTKSKYDGVSQELAAILSQWGRSRITYCGVTLQSLDLSVVVQFVDHHEADLAKTIRSFFYTDFGYSPWKTSQVEHIQWRENPSTTSRIVIFSNHSHANGVKAAFNDCRLLPEKVDRWEKEEGMAADLTIIVFDRAGKDGN